MELDNIKCLLVQQQLAKHIFIIKRLKSPGLRGAYTVTVNQMYKLWFSATI